MSTNFLAQFSANLSTISAVNINYSTLVGSTIIASSITSNSTINVSSITSRAINYSTMTGSTILAQAVNYSTLTGSTINANTISIASRITTSSILATGNVGIGTNDPNALMQINSTTGNRITSLYISTPQSGIMLDSTSSTGGRSYNIWSSHLSDSVGAGCFVIFDQTSSAYRMVISATGSVGIGTTNPAARLHVFADGNVQSGILVENNAASSAGAKTLLASLANSAATLMPSMSGSTFFLYGRSGASVYQYTVGGSAYFTGQHGNQPIDSDLKTNIQNYIGFIVSSADQGYYSINSVTGAITTGADAIMITEALPYINLTTVDQDPAIWGVLSNVRNDSVNTDGTIPKDNDTEFGDRLGTMVRVNGLGEGALWVTNINGNISNGDYICSSIVPGYGRKQNDDLMHNYTVAKATMSCNFDLNNNNLYKCKMITYNNTEYIAAFIGCSYHCS